MAVGGDWCACCRIVQEEARKRTHRYLGRREKVLVEARDPKAEGVVRPALPLESGALLCVNVEGYRAVLGW